MWSPIVLFVYNRPSHTESILNSLSANKEAIESILYIYCDGAKVDCNEDDLRKIIETRNIVKKENRFKDVIIVEQPANKGLANSIIDGVSEVINKHGRVIVVEDDLKLSPYFLYYMNDSLNRYENNEKVGQIGGCNFFACDMVFPSTFFIPIPDCLGWATWKNRWVHFNSNAEYLMRLLKEKNIIHKFNVYGSCDMEGLLKMQIEGKVSSWAIRWQAVSIIKNWLTLYPNPSVTNHLASSNATHANVNIEPPLCMHLPVLKTVPVEEIPDVIEAMKNGYAKTRDSHSNNMLNAKSPKRNGISLLGLIKMKIKAFIPKNILSYYRRDKIKKIDSEILQIWSGNYSSWSEAKSQCTGYDSNIILEKCKTSLLKVKNGEAVYERDSVLFGEMQYSWGLLAGLQRAALENNGNLCVLDFGGSMGSTYFQNRDFLKSIKNLEWCIVEQFHFVKTGKENFETDQLKFYFAIEECLLKHKPDVILLSGVLQYLENPYEWIEKIINYKVGSIIIDRTSISPSTKDILTVQKVPEHIYSASYPSWFFNKENLLKAFKGYKTLASFQSFCDKPIVLNSSCHATWEGFILRLNNQ